MSVFLQGPQLVMAAPAPASILEGGAAGIQAVLVMTFVVLLKCHYDFAVTFPL